jgi:hypothetical protein
VSRRYPTVNRAAIVSSHLREAFAELQELPGAANITLTMSPSEPYFRLAASGAAGSCKVDFPQVRDALFTRTFLCCHPSLRSTFRPHPFAPSGVVVPARGSSRVRLELCSWLWYAGASQGSESFVSFNSTAPQEFDYHLSLLQVRHSPTLCAQSLLITTTPVLVFLRVCCSWRSVCCRQPRRPTSG